MIAVSGLTKYFGHQTLFTDVAFQLNPGNRYGLVGANGSGKSTLLRILTGEETPSEGTVSIPKRLRIGVLGQDHFRFDNVSILEVAMMGHEEVWSAMTEKEELLAKADTHFDADRYAELEDVILRHDGYALEARAGEVLEGLGLATEIHRQPMSTLSGGFRLRVLMAQALAATPDALLLDEPTNHLDILSIRWLEKFLADFNGVVMVISHDHRFLDNVCTHILDVDYETVILYPGNYDTFRRSKIAERERREGEIERQEKKIADQQQFVDRFRAKATKARQAQNRARMIEKMTDDIVQLPRSSRRYPRFKFKQRRHSGKDVVTVDGISKTYIQKGPTNADGKPLEKKVLEDVSLTVRRGDRLAIIGPNGIGKSTLLKIMMGEVKADAGEIEWGYEAQPGYFAQDHREQFDNERQSVEAWLWDICPTEPIGFVRGQLGAALFSGDEVEKPVGSISGGEAARLLFARMSVEQPNVLILDEPTNHLDLEAIEALVKGLIEYDGTLIFVSHDRWFVSQLATRVLEISPRGLRDHQGTYQDYLEVCGDDHLDADAALLRVKRAKAKAKAAAKGGGNSAAGNQKDKKRQRKLEKRRDQLTLEMEEAEGRIGEINELFCDPTFFDKTPHPAVRKLETEQKGLTERVDALMTEWQGIEDELEQISG